jgi:hypothetical protein
MESALEAHVWDLIISDYSIPGFGGPAALKLYQKKDLDFPFIMVSGEGEALAVEMVKSGAHNYVMKDQLGRLGGVGAVEVRGVLHRPGGGELVALGVEDRVDLRMGTFSKSLASCGGFIAGPADVIEFLRVQSRAFLFTASAVPAAVGAAQAALRIVRTAEGRELMARVKAVLRRGTEETSNSLIKIGDHFNRDHTTALHGIKKIETNMRNRDITYKQVQDLTRIIRNRARGA